MMRHSAAHREISRPRTTAESRSVRLVALAFVVLAASPGGCIDTRFVRVPELIPRSALVEQRAAEYHDPFPDDSMGPSMNSRPPSFSRQRTSTRRAAELRGVHMLEPDDPLPSTGGMPPRISRTVSID